MLRIVLATLVAALCLAPRAAEAQQPPVTLRVASLAPDGSTSALVLRTWAKSIRDRTSGSVSVDFSFGGIAGDERDVLRKMRLGTLDGALLTGTGLAQVSRAFAALETPMLIETDEELDFLRLVLGAELRQKVQATGHVFLAWAVTGARTLYAPRPITAVGDMRTVRPWMNVDDAVWPQILRRLGSNGVALRLTEVFPALQIGMVDTVVASAIDALAFQWFRYVTHDCSLPLGPGIAGLVMRQGAFDRLTPSQRQAVLDASVRFEEVQITQVRAADLQAAQTLDERGMRTSVPTPELLREMATVARETAIAVVGAAWMARVEQELAWYRANVR